MDLGLTGKVVVISGAASGIGRACAVAFAEEGARVGILDVADGAGKQLQEELAANYEPECAFVAADVSSDIEVAAAMVSIAARFGGIDIVVGCAGVSGPFGVRVDEISVDDWDTVMAVNVKGQFLLVKHAAKYLAASADSSVVLIGSDSSFVASDGMLAYNASKGAVLQMTRALSLDLAEAGVRVNCVCPSITDTPMSQTDLGAGMISQDDGAGFDYPVQTPGQVAGHVLYLASQRSAPINGTSLVSDYGYLARSSYPA